MRNHALEGKKERIELLKKMISRLVSVDYKRLVSMMQISMGISEKTAVGYLDALEGIEMVKIENGVVELVDKK